MLTGVARRPFLLAALVALLAALRIYLSWKEHVARDQSLQVTSRACLGGLHTLLGDPAMCFLTLIQSFFESAMYVFVFLWTKTLDDNATPDWHPPLGIVFGCFMLAVMAGSSLFHYAIGAGYSVTRILRLVFLSATCALLAAAYLSSPPLVFIAFVLFEASCGLYLPAIGTLRAELLPEQCRAAIMGWMRVPLNTLVVIVLLLAGVWPHFSLMIIGAAFCLLALLCNSLLSKALISRSSSSTTQS